jgi:hypothetical protein
MAMTTIDTTCPVCSAPHARRLAVIHAEGISTVQTDINTVGKFNTIGRQKITTKGTATGVQQTQASKDAARPIVPKLVSRGQKIQYGIAILGGVISFYGLCVGWPLISGAGVVFAFGVVLVSGKPTPEEIARFNDETQEIRAAADLWDKTFQCVACGERFVPSEMNAA